MAGITGLSTTFNLPNFVGPLFTITPQDTPLLSAIGGLTGGEDAGGSWEFGWQFYDLRDAGQNTRVEGATAPTAEARVLANATNVLQIHQEKVSTSYTKTASTNMVTPAAAELQVAGVDADTNEHARQLRLMVAQIARDVEYSFIRGSYVKPSTNATARKTRGLIEAIATNTVSRSADAIDVTADATANDFTATAHGLTDGTAVTLGGTTAPAGVTLGTTYYVVTATANDFQLAATRGGTAIDLTDAGTSVTVAAHQNVTENSVYDVMQLAWANGGLQEGETRVAITNGVGKRWLSSVFIDDRPRSANVGGVNVTEIDTDFGPLRVMLNRFMPTDKIVIASLEELSPVMLQIPGKGYFFEEPLAKTGASFDTQLYGEIGLRYGNERKHALLTGITDSNPTG